MATILSSIDDREQVRAALLNFARAVNREVCIRASDHAADSPDEHRQKNEGVCAPMHLDAVRELLGFLS